MAATLVEGQKYGLDSKDSISGNKTFIHFKLTDSALRALEEFSKIKGCSRKPTVQFSDKTGVMSIPGMVSSDDPKAERRFQLNLSKHIGDANGSFDCVQQTRTRYSTGLSCLGSMQYKISTNANNDVYSDTRKKIAIADNESKKICAKEIKMSGRVNGKKIKKVIPSSQFKALNSGKPASMLPSSRHALSLSAQSQSTTSSSASNHLPASSALSSSHSSVSDSLSATSKSASLVTCKDGVMTIGPNSCVLALTMPIRDRVVHLLALRSYKKPELVYRLMRDGIHEDDRNSLDAVLKPLTVVGKDSAHTLSKEGWQFFRADWPLYNEADRHRAKRNRVAAETRPSVSPPAVSPAVRPADSPSPPQKRTIDDAADQTLPSKKRRTAQHDDPVRSPPHGKLPNGPTPLFGKNNFHQHSAQHDGPVRSHPNGKLPNGSTPLFGKNNFHQHNHRTSGGSTGSLSNSSDFSVDSVGSLASGASDKDSPVPESPSSNCENLGKGDDQDSSMPDYMLHYCKIKTCDQRLKYKDDFNKEYSEYRELHGKVEDVSRRFEHLKERIDNTQEGSARYEELRNIVLQEYKQHKSNAQFLSRKKRVDYLHSKLSHIKQLIMDYDRNCHLAQCS